MTMHSPQTFVVPVPPYTREAPSTIGGPLATPQAQRVVQTFAPAIAYKPLPAARAALRFESGLVASSIVLFFCAALMSIACIVHALSYRAAAAHWATNASLTAEARQLGVDLAKRDALIRVSLFGPGALLFGVVGTVVLVKSVRRRR